MKCSLLLVLWLLLSLFTLPAFAQGDPLTPEATDITSPPLDVSAANPGDDTISNPPDSAAAPPVASLGQSFTFSGQAYTVDFTHKSSSMLMGYPGFKPLKW